MLKVVINKMIINHPRIKEINPIWRKVYTLWKSMMDRCYKETAHNYKYYGHKGVIVCDRWKQLENFIEDIDKIKGFDLDKLLNGEISLDKDIAVKGNKVYCLEFCRFVCKESNNKTKPNQQREIVGISPNGEEIIFTNQSEFARQHNLKQSTISDCLSGRCKTHRGWKFTYTHNK